MESLHSIFVAAHLFFVASVISIIALPDVLLFLPSAVLAARDILPIMSVLAACVIIVIRLRAAA